MSVSNMNLIHNNNSIIIRNSMSTLRRCNINVSRDKTLCMSKDTTYEERKELVNDIFIFSPIVLILLIICILK